MSEIIDQFYTPLLIEHGFIHDPDNQQYGALGDCWKLSPEVGEGSYWTYGQKDLYDIKIHNFSFHEDFMLDDYINKLKELCNFGGFFLLILLLRLFWLLFLVKFVFDFLHIGLGHANHDEVGEDVEEENRHADEVNRRDVRVDKGAKFTTN